MGSLIKLDVLCVFVQTPSGAASEDLKDLQSTSAAGSGAALSEAEGPTGLRGGAPDVSQVQTTTCHSGRLSDCNPIIPPVLCV